MTQYIEKSALIAEIESKIKEWKFGSSSEAKYRLEVYKELSEWLNGIESKEVDLEKELKKLDNILYDLDGVAIAGATHYLTVEDVKDIAKHFFELGLNYKE
jgi:hypothetical protein